MVIARRVLTGVAATMWAQARTLVLVTGLLMLHVGLRELEVWVPGAAWSGPGLIVTGIAIFGARGGPAPRRPQGRI